MCCTVQCRRRHWTAECGSNRSTCFRHSYNRLLAFIIITTVRCETAPRAYIILYIYTQRILYYYIILYLVGNIIIIIIIIIIIMDSAGETRTLPQFPRVYYIIIIIIMRVMWICMQPKRHFSGVVYRRICTACARW